LVLASILAPATLATAALLPCADEPSLDDLVQCVVDHMPRSGTEGYLVPDSTALADWRVVVAEMLDGGCEQVALPASLADAFEIRTVTSADRRYCVLVEVTDADEDGIVDRGWGTVIVAAEPERPLSIQVPHPLNDTATPAEGIAVFEVSSRLETRVYALKTAC
jgi:hypothetical protein